MYIEVSANMNVSQELSKVARDLVGKEKRIDVLRRIIDNHQYEKIDGKVVDAATASMLVTVFNALSSNAQKKFDKIPLKKMIDFGWSMVN